IASWPQVKEELHDELAVKEMSRLMAIIKSVRNIRAEVDTPMSKKINMLIEAENEQIVSELERNRAYVERFCNTEKLEIAAKLQVPDKAMTAVVTGAEIFLPLEGLIDIDKELERLEKELDKWTQEVDRVKKKLSNEGFVNKAPEALVESERQKERDYLEKQEKVKARLEELKG